MVRLYSVEELEQISNEYFDNVPLKEILKKHHLKLNKLLLVLFFVIINNNITDDRQAFHFFYLFMKIYYDTHSINFSIHSPSSLQLGFFCIRDLFTEINSLKTAYGCFPPEEVKENIEQNFKVICQIISSIF